MKLPIPYKEHEIRNRTGTWYIFRNKKQLSSLAYGSEKAAMMAIDRIVGKPSYIDTFLEPVREPDNLRTVGNYSNRGYLQLLNEGYEK